MTQKQDGEYAAVVVLTISAKGAERVGHPASARLRAGTEADGCSGAGVFAGDSRAVEEMLGPAA